MPLVNYFPILLLVIYYFRSKGSVTKKFIINSPELVMDASSAELNYRQMVIYPSATFPYS